MPVHAGRLAEACNTIELYRRLRSVEIKSLVEASPAKRTYDLLLLEGDEPPRTGEVLAAAGPDSLLTLAVPEAARVRADAARHGAQLQAIAAAFLEILSEIRTFLGEEGRRRLPDAVPAEVLATLENHQSRLEKEALGDLGRLEPAFAIEDSTLVEMMRSACAHFGFPPERIAIERAVIPFWGESFDTLFNRSSTILIGRRSGLQFASALFHELGHCAENLVWDRGFTSFFAREPASREACAYVFQSILERADWLALLAPHLPGEEICRAIRRHKPKELAYLFLLMDLDRHIWQAAPPTLESLSEVYRRSTRRLFGFEPASPWGFAKEPIHFLLPGYMANYLYAELLSTALRPGLSTLGDLPRAVREVHDLDAAAVPELLARGALRRVAELREVAGG